MLDTDDEKVIKEAKKGGAVLVTWDRVVRLAAGGITPYEAMDKGIAENMGTPRTQAGISRLRKLTPLELTVLKDQANENWERFRQYIPMNIEQASIVRELRVEGDYSWRAVARWCSWVWHAPWGSNQLAGMAICQKAAEELGEDFLKEPWN